MTRLGVAALALWAIGLRPSVAVAQTEAEREAAMFGEPADPSPADAAGHEPTTATPAAPAASADDEAAREAALFGEATPTSPSTPLVIREDPLAIGGRLILTTQASFFEDVDLGDQPIGMPTLLDVYLDARPNDRVRAYFRGRLAYDPTIVSTLGIPLIDQLWLKFDSGRWVFWTVGTQPIRWGTGRIWNPTDVINRARLDPLSPIDLRTGVPLVKAQIPIAAIGGSLQLVGSFAEAQQLGDVGGAARLEAAGEAFELGLAVGTGRDRPLFMGADLSTKLGALDAYGEVAVAHGGGAHRWDAAAEDARDDRADDWIPQAVGGLEWPIEYGDEDTLYVGVEYLFNDAGYEDDALYDWLREQGDFTPFYLGRHYAAAYMVVAAPGRFDDTTLSLNAIYNASDRSGVVRVNWSQRVLTYLYVEPFAVVSVGHAGGEFRAPTAIGLTNETGRPLGQLGAWFRLEI